MYKKNPQSSGEITTELPQEFVDIELTKSIVEINEKSSYRNNYMFIGNFDFKKDMAKDRFTPIHSTFRFYPTYYSEVACKDALWHSRYTGCKKVFQLF